MNHSIRQALRPSHIESERDGDAAILAIIVPIAAATRLQALAHDFERVLVSR